MLETRGVLAKMGFHENLNYKKRSTMCPLPLSVRYPMYPSSPSFLQLARRPCRAVSRHPLLGHAPPVLRERARVDGVPREEAGVGDHQHGQHAATDTDAHQSLHRLRHDERCASRVSLLVQCPTLYSVT